jgi:hypothetical protein
MDLDEQKNILNVFRQLIEMSQRRGVWMANEMQHIGLTYTRVESILEGIEKYEEEEIAKKTGGDKPKEDKSKQTHKPKQAKKKVEPAKE